MLSDGHMHLRLPQSAKRKIRSFEYGHQPMSWRPLGDISFPYAQSLRIFDSLGHRPKEYMVGFEKILTKKYIKILGITTTIYVKRVRLLRHE